MKLSLLVCLFYFLGVAQERPPFMRLKLSNIPIYESQLEQLERGSMEELDRIDKIIELSSRYHDWDELIKTLNAKIDLVGEDPVSRYALGGINGIKAMQTSKLFSVPYVKKMLYNLERSIDLDSTYLPALEASVESFSMIPSILGGDLDRARELAEQTLRVSALDGYFSKAYLAQAVKDQEGAQKYYLQAFEILVENDLCEGDLTAFFQKRSPNFPYKIAEVSAVFELYPHVGLCALEYLMKEKKDTLNFSIEWIYFREAQLHILLSEVELARISISKALEINPSFREAKQLQFQINLL
jgi:tetratricopeptide (TPR) repeat protein